MSATLSLRPDLDQNVDALPLYVLGTLPSGKPFLAYEGRLQIMNPAGPCTVEQIGGDALPPGASLTVDADVKQVVVAWPAYSEYVAPLQNPGFEAGGVSGWTFVTRGGAGVPVVDGAYRYEGTKSLRWPGGRGMGSEGGIELEAWNNTIGPCLPGRRVTIHTRCMYNPAGHHFGSRYQGMIRFLDASGLPIGGPSRGKQFKGRGNNGRWNDASASAVAPAGTTGVQLGAWLTASEAPVWLDAASWDVPASLGVNVDKTFQLILRVRDSAGRTALWSGQIVVKAAGDYTSYTSYFAPDGRADGYRGDLPDFCPRYVGGGYQVWKPIGNAVVSTQDSDFAPNGCVVLDGSGTYYESDTAPAGGLYGWPSDPASGQLSDFTLEISLKTTQTGVRVLVDGYFQVEGYYQLCMNADGRAAFYVYGSGYLVVGTSAINDGRYHEVKLARTTAAGVYTLTVDGVVEATVTNSAVRLRYNRPSIGAQVGTRNPAYDFAGKIGYVRAWVRLYV